MMDRQCQNLRKFWLSVFLIFFARKTSWFTSVRIPRYTFLQKYSQIKKACQFSVSYRNLDLPRVPKIALCISLSRYSYSVSATNADWITTIKLPINSFFLVTSFKMNHLQFTSCNRVLIEGNCQNLPLVLIFSGIQTQFSQSLATGSHPSESQWTVYYLWKHSHWIR